MVLDNYYYVIKFDKNDQLIVLCILCVIHTHVPKLHDSIPLSDLHASTPEYCGYVTTSGQDLRRMTHL